MRKGSQEFINLLDVFERTVGQFSMVRVGNLVREKSDEKGVYYQDGKTNEAFICFMNGAAYQKAEMLDVLKECDALKTEIDRLNKELVDLRPTHEKHRVNHAELTQLVALKDRENTALKAQNADLLVALESTLPYIEATLDNHDVACQRHPCTEAERQVIVEDRDQVVAAIKQAKGE